MHRREFLQPKRLAHTAGHVAGAVEALRAQDDRAVEEIALLRFARQAMATKFEIVLPFGTPHALAAANAALDEIHKLEAQLTVYRDDSEVSAINRLAATRAVPVEARLFDLFQESERLTAETEGAFDITAGALVKVWGFYKGPPRVPEKAERLAALERLGMRHVQLDTVAHTVRFQRSGLEINLGSIGKGYALDRAAEVLRREWNVSSALLHGGHSSVYALGTPPGDERGWAVGISHPWHPGRRLALLRLRDRALGTSASTFRHLEWLGRKLGHILDPRTGWPAEGMASVSIVGPSAAQADALATAFFILGVEKARSYCDHHPEIGAVLLPADPHAGPLTVNLEDGGDPGSSPSFVE
jgi:thiamine biosynthesis lipoprotein